MVSVPASSLAQLVVVVRSDQRHAVAATRIAAGDVIMTLGGRIVAAADRHTLQIAENEHLAAVADASGVHPAWRFLNHACEPNACLDGRRLIALFDLAPGDEVTFDYDTTEWDMAAPFACACGALSCRRTIRGYRHLSPAQRQRLQRVGPHLLRLAAAAQPA